MNSEPTNPAAEEEADAPPAESQTDAHVEDDVCVAALAAKTGRRRKDRSMLWAIGISLTCHAALAAVWWQWGPVITPPDFSIRGGAGGSPGYGAIDETAAGEPAQIVLPANEPSADRATPRATIEEDVAAPATPPRMTGALHDSLPIGNDLISMGPRGWSPPETSAGESLGIGDGSNPADVASPTGKGELPKVPLNSGTGGGDGLARNSLSTNAANDPPDYPEEARRNRWQGTVKLRMRIDPVGRVHDVTVVQSSGYKALDRSAVDKFSTYLVSPYRENGVPMEVEVTKPVIFQLRDHAGPGR